MKAALAALAVALAVPASAQQSNFQFSPPPIPYPYFEPGRVDVKLDGLFINMSGTGFDFTGMGANFAGRKAMNEKLALDGSFGMFVAGGDFDLGGSFGSIKPTLLAMNFGGALEGQFIHTPRGSLIGYVGVLMPISIMTFDKFFTLSGQSITPTSITTVMFGMPFGLQAGIPMGQNWTAAPFVSIVPFFGGTATLSYEDPVSAFAPLTADIDPFTAVSFGADFIYKPWNLSLGTLFQQAAGSTGANSTEDVKTTMILLSWHWRRG